MYDHAYTILGIVVAVFLIAKALRLSTELSMLASVIAAAAYHGTVWSGEVPIRHLVEGTFSPHQGFLSEGNRNRLFCQRQSPW